MNSDPFKNDPYRSKELYNICIIYIDGNKKKVYGIENPFAYINELKKNPKIKTAFIIK